jgi:hypothetical protein
LWKIRFAVAEARLVVSLPWFTGVESSHATTVELREGAANVETDRGEDACNYMNALPDCATRLAPAGGQDHFNNCQCAYAIGANPTDRKCLLYQVKT